MKPVARLAVVVASVALLSGCAAAGGGASTPNVPGYSGPAIDGVPGDCGWIVTLGEWQTHPSDAFADAQLPSIPDGGCLTIIPDETGTTGGGFYLSMEPDYCASFIKQVKDAMESGRGYGSIKTGTSDGVVHLRGSQGPPAAQDGDFYRVSAECGTLADEAGDAIVDRSLLPDGITPDANVGNLLVEAVYGQK